MADSGAASAILEGRKLKLTGPGADKKFFIKAAKVVEGLSKITEISVDFLVKDRALKLEDLVGKEYAVEVMLGGDEASADGSGGGEQWRKFMGHCIEAQYIGEHEGYGYYSMQLRSWNWFLTRTTDNKIYQEMKTDDIIKQVFGDHGFAEFTMTLNRAPSERLYTVQYGESDFDFVGRLMEEEGMYFFSGTKGNKDHLYIYDDIGAHSPVPNAETIEFYDREEGYRRKQDHIFEWRGGEGVVPGKVTLNDWNFEKPKAKLKSVKDTPKGKHSHKNYELYQYPGRYRETAEGDIFARVKEEAEVAKNKVQTAIGNVRTLAAGATFKLNHPNRSGDNDDYLITSAVHMLQIEQDQEDQSQKVEGAKSQQSEGEKAPKLPSTIVFDEENKDAYRCTMNVIPKTTPFRAPLTTKWPKIAGILIAEVTGPSGEEIHTDEFGRIKVQFPWDRFGQKDDKTTCWVRVVTPWSGKNWGMISIPRIGQEVVIQFEDGEVDRPICTGMLYNKDTMPPYALPANKTQSGIKTNSSKGGDGFNELMMEDKKGEELVRFQSEKDYEEIIKNKAKITVGMDKKDPGTYDLTIFGNRTETVDDGNFKYQIKKGNSEIAIDKGDAKYDVKTGKHEETIKGTFSSDVTGSITIESKQKIELKVGGNSITIDMSGIKIIGAMIETNANGMAQHKSGGLMIIQGQTVLIN